MAPPLVIHIQPVEVTQLVYYVVYLGPYFLLGPTPRPYTDAAIELLSLGYDPTRKLLMRRRGVDVNQLEYTLEHAAELVVENQANPPFEYPLEQYGPGIAP